MLRRGSVAIIYYKYPCEPHPRTTMARYVTRGSILDAVAIAISRDADIRGGDTSDNPAMTLLNVLEGMPEDPKTVHIRHALAYASIQPLPYQPTRRVRVPKRAAREPDHEETSRKRARVKARAA